MPSKLAFICPAAAGLGEGETEAEGLTEADGLGETEGPGPTRRDSRQLGIEGAGLGTSKLKLAWQTSSGETT